MENEKKEIETINGKVLTDNQKLLIKRTVAKDVTNDEFIIFLHMARKYNLDPFLKQIWCIKLSEYSPAQIFTSRDGFLDIAHRSGHFDGMAPPEIVRIEEPFEIEFYNKKTKLKEVKKYDFQYSSTTTVYRNDMKHPFVVTIYEDEYSTGRNLWLTKRRTMCGKVSESQCLRKAFSISGMYAPEERGQDIIVEVKETKLQAEPIEVKDHNFLEYVESEIRRKTINWIDVQHELKDRLPENASLPDIKEVIKNLKTDEVQPIKEKLNIIIQENKDKTANTLFESDGNIPI